MLWAARFLIRGSSLSVRDCAVSASRSKDQEITFLGEGAKKLFENSRIIDFLSFWRVAVPVVFGILLIVFVLANVFLGHGRT